MGTLIFVILLLLCKLKCYWLNGLFLNMDNQAIKLYMIKGTSKILFSVYLNIAFATV